MQKRIRSFDGTTINYSIIKNSKKYIVFIHGIGGDLTSWKHERKFLHTKGFSTIAIDLRGHGLSGRPQNKNDYLMHNFVRDVYEVIKKEEISEIILVGHSFGGALTILFDKLYPTLSEKYILIDSTFRFPKMIRIIIEPLINFLEVYHTIFKIKEKDFHHQNPDKFKDTTEINLQRLYSDISHTSFRTWLYSYYNFGGFNATKVLKKMKKDLLILQGSNDHFFPISTAKKIKKMVRKSKIEIIPNEDHVIVIHNPIKVSHVIYNFIK